MSRAEAMTPVMLPFSSCRGRAEARNTRQAPFLCCVRYSIWPSDSRFRNQVVKQFAASRCGPAGSVRPPMRLPINSSGRNPRISKICGLTNVYRPSVVERDDQVRETVHQAAREFLFAVQAALHLPLLGDIHERSLVAHKFSGRIADGRGGMNRNNLAPVLPMPQRYFVRAQESQAGQLVLFFRRGPRTSDTGRRFRD